VHHLFARMNSREVVESEAERLRETKPALGTLTILLPQEAAKLIGVKSTLLSSWRVADDVHPTSRWAVRCGTTWTPCSSLLKAGD
jgi:hypothetical protein